ncbi:MAG: hypothetical protein Q9164_006233 [Protoblastenia rupestris]
MSIASAHWRLKGEAETLSLWEKEDDDDGDYSVDSGDEIVGETSDGDGYKVFEDLRLRTQCLVDLVPLLDQELVMAEKPSSRNASSKVAGCELSPSANYFVSLVRDKFKQAENYLVERLGEANWQRHKLLRKQLEDTTKDHVEEWISLQQPGSPCDTFRPRYDLQGKDEYQEARARKAAFTQKDRTGTGQHGTSVSSVMEQLEGFDAL